MPGSRGVFYPAAGATAFRVKEHRLLDALTVRARRRPAAHPIGAEPADPAQLGICAGGNNIVDKTVESCLIKARWLTALSVSRGRIGVGAPA
jgi:hypothetical protein